MDTIYIIIISEYGLPNFDNYNLSQGKLFLKTFRVVLHYRFSAIVTDWSIKYIA